MNTFEHPLISAQLAKLRETLMTLATSGEIDTKGLALIWITRTAADVAIMGCDCTFCRARFSAAVAPTAEGTQPGRARH